MAHYSHRITNNMNPLSPIVFRRHFALAIIAACSWAEVSLAQSGADATNPAPGAGATPAANEVGTPAPATPAPGTDVPATAEPKAGTGAGKVKSAAGAANATGGEKARSPFRVGESATSEPSGRRSSLSRNRSGSSRTTGETRISEQPADEGAASSAAKLPTESPAPFISSGFYGQGQQVMVPGQGRLARPRFRYGFSVANGYDDNTFQTPSVNLAGVAQPKKGTGLTTIGGHWDVQWAKPRSLFTLDLSAGATFYWNRNRVSEDFNTRLATMYLYRIDPRTQVTANVSFAYLSQPDYSNIYASQSTVGGNYITGSAKFDLFHRWTPHFSTNTSAAVDLLYYTAGAGAGLSNSYLNYTLGNEFRFNQSPHLTWVLEGRYAWQRYMDNSNLDSETAFFLGGVDWIWSRRLSTTLRVGAAMRSFDVGGSSTDPYVEVATTYQTGRRSALVMTGRYGFEPQNAAGNRDLSYRLGLAYRHALTYRLSGDIGFNYIRTESTPVVGPRSNSDTYDFNAGLNYRLNRHLSLGARYFYTQLNSSTGLQDYDRNRFLLSADYEF